MKLRVFKLKQGIEKGWDEVKFETEIEVVETIEGESNEECEQKAIDQGYGDSEIYGWNY